MIQAALTPIDFNSLSKAENGIINLSDYYIDYAFRSEGAQPVSGMEITFYDEGWTAKPGEVVCIDAVIEKKSGSDKWLAKLKGRVYTVSTTPSRKFFNAFIGGESNRIVEGEENPQKLGSPPTKDKLNGISCFAFSPGPALPNFSSIVGMNVAELHTFFQFAGFKPPQLVDGKYPDDTLIVRGGSNKIRGG